MFKLKDRKDQDGIHMDYEKITDKLIQKTLREFKLEQIYQEFLDSLVRFDDFKVTTHEEFQEYLDNLSTEK